MSELNPGHPVTKAAHGNWHKIVVAIMYKLKITEIVITGEDLAAIPDDTVIALDSKQDHFKVFLTNTATANELVREKKVKS